MGMSAMKKSWIAAVSMQYHVAQSVFLEATNRMSVKKRALKVVTLNETACKIQ